jgi:hypothetical protein
MELKRVDRLSIADFKRFPVWTYVPETRTRDETWMRPVRKLPVSDFDNKLVGARVRFSNGRQVWAMTGNVDVKDPVKTEQFLGLSLRIGRSWFHRARYHDIDHKSQDPKALAAALNMRISDIFPITYDLRPFARGNPNALRGQVFRAPKKRLSKSALMRLIFS